MQAQNEIARDVSSPRRQRRVVRIPEPFYDAGCLWGLKIDGPRSLAYIEKRECGLVWRHGHTDRRLSARLVGAIDAGAPLREVSNALHRVSRAVYDVVGAESGISPRVLR